MYHNEKALRLFIAGGNHSCDRYGTGTCPLGHHNAFAFVIFHGHLGFAVRAEALDGPGLAGVGERQRQPMGQDHGQGEELGRLRTGEAVHDPLVASPHLTGAAHSPGDVAALIVGDNLHLVIAGIAGFCPRRCR